MRKILYILAGGALLLSACNESFTEEDNVVESTISFNGAIATQTRVSSNAFEVGDEILVNAYDADQLFADQVSYTHDGSLFSSSTPITYSNNVQTLSFKAVYPAVEGFVNSFSFEVFADQSVDGNYEDSDLLIAQQEAQGDSCPTLTFDHVLSNMNMNILDAELAGGVVTLYAMSSVEVDLSATTYTASGEVEELTMGSSDEASYRVIFAPQVISAGELVATYQINGTTYSWIASEDLTFLPGYSYTYSWNLIDNSVTYNGNINGWDDCEIDG